MLKVDCSGNQIAFREKFKARETTIQNVGVVDKNDFVFHTMDKVN